MHKSNIASYLIVTLAKWGYTDEMSKQQLILVNKMLIVLDL